MKRALAFFIVIFLLFPGAAVSAEPLVLGSLDWPPFVGADLPGQGRVAMRVRTICDAAGMDLRISFLPWKRVLLSMQSGSVEGFFPEYASGAGRERYYFSRPVGCSVLGLVYRRIRPVRWSSLEDLAGLVLGVVDGYVNSEEFDRLVRNGVLRTVKCNSDVLALRMIRAGRVDAVVMDRDVFHFLTASDGPDQEHAPLAFSSKPFAVNTLHVCFPKTPRGADLVERFDRAAEAVGLVQDCPGQDASGQ